jgi:sugar (pentulose or hexulose) kinase
MYPQYWTWKLSGQLATEVTSLGCHTDLWNFKSNSPSSLLEALGLQHSLPPIKKAWMPIGTIKKSLAIELGLSEYCLVYPGLHDSNAGYVPILRKPKKDRPTIVSTGTWSVIMDCQSDCNTLDTGRDMLVNIDAEGAPLATARYMGGREFGLICERLNTDIATTFTDKDIADIISSETYILPSFCSGTGPYPKKRGHVIFGKGNRHINGKAAATIYSALMVNNILKRLNPSSAQDIIVEGSFAANSVLCSLLATLNPNRTVRTQKGGNGVTEGCFLLTQWNSRAHEVENPIVTPYPSETFLSYAAEWGKRL